jgi:hypothetical protein
MLLEMRAQQRLGDRDPVLAQRSRRFHQARVVRRELDVLSVRIVGAARVTDRGEMIAERAPCVRHLRLEAHRAPQGGDCTFAVALRAERQAELVVRCRPLWLRLCQRLEDSLRCSRIARAAVRHTEQERGQRVAGRDLEDFRCLLGRKPRLRGHQALCVSQRRFECSDRFF